MSKMDEFTMVIVGSGGVGKSCLTIRYLKDQFTSEYDPTIEENYRKKIQLEKDYEVMLEVVDTAGQQEYTSLRDQHLRTGQGFLLVCALNDPGSFEEMKELHDAILRVKDDGEKVPFVIAANKCDLPDRTIDEKALKAWAEAIKAPYFETSAKSNINVGDSFLSLVKEMAKVYGSKNADKKKKKGIFGFGGK